MTSTDSIFKAIVKIITNLVEIPKLERHLLEYIDPAMESFKKTNDIFTKNFNNKGWELPKIQMEMALDSR